MTTRNRDHLIVGDVRPSQMMYTYGVGSIVDLPNLSVIVMGLDDWEAFAPSSPVRPLIEPRLLEAVRQVPLLTEVDELRPLPRSEQDTTPGPRFGAASLEGVPVAVFPRWWVCPRCRQLAPIQSGIFVRGKEIYPPDRIRYVHTGCPTKSINPQVIPARILVTCESGHLDDFPWVHFVHRGKACALSGSTLKLEEYGVSGEVRDLTVKCSCGQARRLADAFGRDNRGNLPLCSGRHPHLRRYDQEGCSRDARAIALGASNLWFPISLTVLSLPTDDYDLYDLIDAEWTTIQQAQRVDMLQMLISIKAISSNFDKFDPHVIMQAIEAYRKETRRPKAIAPTDIKAPEYAMLTQASPGKRTRDFQTRRVALRPDWKGLHISDLVLVERLREVQAMLGFARLDAVGELTDPEQRVSVAAAPLSNSRTRWVPASELRGEGLFFRFDEAAIAEWEAQPDVRDLEGELRRAHITWRSKRGIEPPDAGFPGIRYALLHSFSHAVMRQMALEVGYNAASLRERIYSTRQPESPMAGVLIYTAAPDSEGTLGGLIGLGADEDGLYRLIVESLRALTLCASDPLCAEREVETDGKTIHGAACHACLFAPETSCERGNRYLDRTVLVRTIASEREALAFFGEG